MGNLAKKEVWETIKNGPAMLLNDLHWLLQLLQSL